MPPDSRLVSRAPRRSRCSPYFIHGLLSDRLAEAINCSGAFDECETRIAAAIRKTVMAYGRKHGISERFVRRPGSLDASANLFRNPR